MNPEQQKAILAIALFAAFADGAKHDREREEIRRIAESLGGEAGAPDLARLYQDVLLKRISLGAAAAALVEPGERQLAYEMAVCVCDADGRQSEAEQRFLDELKALLKLDAGQTAAFEREADAIVELSEAAAPATVAGAAAAVPLQSVKGEALVRAAWKGSARWPRPRLDSKPMTPRFSPSFTVITTGP